MKNLLHKAMLAALATTIVTITIGAKADPAATSRDQFRVTLPPTFSAFTEQTEPSLANEGLGKTTSWVSKSPIGEAVIVTISRMPGIDAVKRLGGARATLLTSLNATLDSDEKFPGDPLAEQLMFHSGGSAFFRAALAVQGDDLYQLLYVGRSSEQRGAPAIEQLFLSFRIKDVGDAHPIVGTIGPAARIRRDGQPAVELPRENVVLTAPSTHLPPHAASQPLIINVKNPPFNAHGDGSDETSKIQSAIAALNAAGGGTLWFPRSSKNVYGVRTVADSALFTLAKLNGVKIAGDGVTINDMSSHYFEVSRLTSAGTSPSVRLATVTTTRPHGLSNGNVVNIYGAKEAEYNGAYRIVVTSPTEFTYVLVGAPTSPATGRIQATTDGVLFRIAACTNASITGIKITAPRKPDYAIPHGIRLISFEQGSSVADLHLSFDGGYAGLTVQKQRRDPEGFRSSLIRAEIKADHVERPYFAYYSANNCDIKIDSNWGGRDFIIIGARKNTIAVTSTNQQGSSVIDQQGGVGNEDIDVSIRNHESTRQNSTNPQLLLQFTDTVPTTVRRIKVVVDVSFAGGTPSGAAFGIWKLNGGSADYVGRGHVLDGLDVSGNMAPWAAADLVNMKGAFKAPDKVSDVRFHDIKSPKSSSAHPKGINFAAGDALQDTLELSNVDAPVAQINVTNETGRVVQQNVIARDLTLRGDDRSPQDYIDCTAVGGSATSKTNKRIQRTSIGGVKLSTENSVP